MENITLTNIEVHPNNGLKKTLSLMYELEQLAFKDPYFIKWVHDTLGSNCTACIPGKIWKYVNENFNFIPDDPYDEIITAPYLMPELKEGDCDDFSLFIKTCMDVLGGYNTNYILFGRKRGEFTHIAVFVNRGSIGYKFIDPVVIDGANENFNLISTKYKYYKLV